jgi:hypothetical protein
MSLPIAIQSSRTSRIRALAEIHPLLDERAIAVLLREQGVQVLASDVRVALGKRVRSPGKSFARL